ncbi:hypothetical protein D3C87_1573120 [compost metagenome]
MKSFGTFNVQTLQEKDVTLNDYVISTLQTLSDQVSILSRRSVNRQTGHPTNFLDYDIEKMIETFYQNNSIDPNDSSAEAINDVLVKAILRNVRSKGYDVSPSVAINMIRNWLDKPKG